MAFGVWWSHNHEVFLAFPYNVEILSSSNLALSWSPSRQTNTQQHDATCMKVYGYESKPGNFPKYRNNMKTIAFDQSPYGCHPNFLVESRTRLFPFPWCRAQLHADSPWHAPPSEGQNSHGNCCTWAIHSHATNKWLTFHRFTIVVGVISQLMWVTAQKNSGGCSQVTSSRRKHKPKGRWRWKGLSDAGSWKSTTAQPNHLHQSWVKATCQFHVFCFEKVMYGCIEMQSPAFVLNCSAWSFPHLNLLTLHFETPKKHHLCDDLNLFDVWVCPKMGYIYI